VDSHLQTAEAGERVRRLEAKETEAKMHDPTTIDRYRTIVFRISLSAGIGILVALIATACVWRDFGGQAEFRPEQKATQQAIEDLAEMTRQYRSLVKMLPRSLKELQHVGDMRVDFPWNKELRHMSGMRADCAWNEAGMSLDGWSRFFAYAIDGNQYTITSLGRDGKPGGVGLDSDLSNANLHTRQALLPFVQFIRRPPARGVVATCLACGVLASALSLIVVKPSEFQGWGLGVLAVKLVVTAVGAILVATFLAAVHVPNYH